MTKNPAAAALGRSGGLARAKALSADQRSSLARAAVTVRWQKFKASKEIGTPVSAPEPLQPSRLIETQPFVVF
jgi:hypothetical protein